MYEIYIFDVHKLSTLIIFIFHVKTIKHDYFWRPSLLASKIIIFDIVECYIKLYLLFYDIFDFRKIYQV